MRSFTAALVLILAWLQYSLWFGTNGYQDYAEVRQEIDVQQAVNNELLQRNNEMYAEIDDLRQGLDAIEERARHELGMIKEGETFYRIIETP
ncbi:cell division protein FtsB [Vibrio sp. qd031]|jgi:cell division protein FtsB|uniref:Cell division protein FtsB n=1 Tax=Vibrio ulleungensis TaxID=2807619 RepID=A0ABS2HK72_9VIBR|nr:MULTISPECIES: cell division protein FtsB [Vibrio]MBM7037890.1 cell division protein FtsB [Vibrio ulleungensis]ORT52142.1 cell division protein FtsB [Vibrio sp. qd031]